MKNIRFFLSEKFQFLVTEFSIYLNRHVFIMMYTIEATMLENILQTCIPNEDRSVCTCTQSDQSVHHAQEKTLHPLLSKMFPMKILIRLHESAYPFYVAHCMPVVFEQETTNVYLGKIFGYLTLVHSGRLFQESKQNIRNVIQQLLKLGQEKSSLQQLCINGLIQIIAQVSVA